MVIDSTGRMVVAGRATEALSQFFFDMVLWRVNSDGTLDSSFSGDGIVSHGNAAGGNLNDIAHAVTLDNSGRILACGESHNGSDIDAVVWRYTTNGSLDTSFNTTGFRIFDNIGGGNLNELCNAIIVDSSDRILITGETDTSTAINMYIMRLLDDGTPDNNFDTDGIVLDNASFSAGHDIKLKVDGDILVGGRINAPNDLAVWRFNSDGSLDTGFNSTSSSPGINITAISSTSTTADLGFALAIDSSNRIYMTGWNVNAGTSDDMLLIRLTESGQLDSSFNPSATPPGIATYHDAAGGNLGDHGLAITLDASGKILVTGSSNSATSTDMATWRISP